MPSKASLLRSMLYSNNLEFLMEAHNGLSAKIVEEAGFKGIWGSGLSISASFGVRDNNELSWTQVLDALEFMSDGTNIPILLDGDTGYGNFNNMRRLVRKLEQRNIAGVCIEDKLFPKTNSFIKGEAQPLADIEEFCGKIKAAKDAQLDEEFVLVARVEAFIAGWGLEEALRRAEAYRIAGADAILMHSKKADPSEIELFMKEWGGRHPVIIVPTKYYSTPTDKFRDLGVSTVIWANHNIRTSIESMQRTTAQIFKDESLINVENNIVSVSEIFRIQGAQELIEAEKKYLPTYGKVVNAIVLAAGQGELGDLTKDTPKAMISVNGKTLLSLQFSKFNKLGIKDITVVRGFGKETIKETNCTVIDNNDYASTKDLYSLYLSKEKLGDNTVISYGDIIFKSHILHELMNVDSDIAILVDTEFDFNGDRKDFVQTSEPYSRKLYTKTAKLKRISSELSEGEINGDFVGLWKVSSKGAQIVKDTMEKMVGRPDFRELSVTDLLNEISKSNPVAVKYITGSWLDINTIRDLQKAGELL